MNGNNYISGGSGFFSGCGGGGSAQTSQADGNPGSMDIQQTGIVSTLSSASNNGDGEASMTYYVPNQDPVIRSVYLNNSEISVGDSVKMIAEVDDPDGVVENAKFNSSSPSGDVFSDKDGSELEISKWESPPIKVNETGNYSLTAYSLTDNGGAVNKTDQTIEFEATNAAPQITSSEFIRDRNNNRNDIILGLDSVGREDISAYQGIVNVDVFTNTTLRKNGVGMPFESVINVSDRLGAFSSNKELSISEQVSGLGERSGYDHSLSVQRIENTVNLSNNAGASVDYELITDLEGSTIQGQTFTGSIPGDGVVSHTSVTESDWIVNESQSTYNKYSDSDYNQSVDKQRIHNRTKLMASNSFDFKFEDVDISSYCSSTSIAEVISGKGTVTNDCNRDTFSGDWITGEQESTESVGQNLSAQSDVNQQTLFNQTRLQVENTRGFSFNNVDVSSKCSQTQSVDVPSGTSTVTNACNNESLTGDWIKNEKNQSTQYVSGDVLFGDGLNTQFEASQSVEVTNVRTSEDLRIDISELVSDLPGCQIENSTKQNVPADSVSQFDFHKSCSPGQHLNRTPVQKTETSDSFKYDIEFGFKINSNVTEEQGTEYAVKSSWVDNWNSRDPTETEAVVDGSGKDVQVDERIIDGTEYIVFQIGDQHTSSSIHTGTHSATLTYYESKSTGSTSGGGDTTSSGGTTLIGGGQTETRVDENNGSAFAWSVSAITSQDAQSFQVNGYPGDSFEKYVVLRNEGDRNVTLNIECVSDTGFCSYVDTDLDNVVLNRNSFSEKEIKVSGTLPMNFSQRDRPATFGIRVTDPDWNGTSRTGESVSFVDFTVSNSPFAGRALDLAFKVVELRSFESPFEQGNDVPYPFIFIPLFLSVLTWGAVSGGEWLFAKKSYSNLKIGVTLLVFLIAFALL
jgi:hypothetical protein